MYIYQIYIYIYIYLLQSRCNNNVRYFSKLLKTHFFVMQIFRSHFGNFFCASNFTIIIYAHICIIYMYIYNIIYIYMCIFYIYMYNIYNI